MVKFERILTSWHTPATDYVDEVAGNFRIHHGSYPKGHYNMWGVDDYVVFRVDKPIPIVSLQERRNGKWHDWMVDDPPQWRSMELLAAGAKGRVLTTGLGLGLIIYGLVKNPDVVSVTVVELNPEVIALTQKYIPSSVTVVQGDYFKVIEQKGTNWDTIILDLWVSHGRKEKLEALAEAIPALARAKILYPNASVSAHGFPTLSDIEVLKPETIKRMVEINSGKKRLVGNHIEKQ